ncbi:hypothetical protein LCGC14_1214170 [marine sediment metagenome]|uniref:HNH nuclease domain-containing protein n=1 Tax=marine sediment metagenome TaxID=412755 RepID=A0A0F9NVH3_9ZZZZ
MPFQARKSSVGIGIGLYCSRSCARSANPSKKRKDQMERFFALVDKKVQSPCWVWIGRKNTGKYKYGQFKDMRTYKTTLAHRIIYEYTYGVIPNGMCVCHHCDNPPCVNPEHLFLGTYKDNKQDAIKKNRIPYGEKHFITTLTEDNVKTIRELKNKTKLITLAKIFNVSSTTIRNIQTNKTWKYVN